MMRSTSCSAAAPPTTPVLHHLPFHTILGCGSPRTPAVDTVTEQTEREREGLGKARSGGAIGSEGEDIFTRRLRPFHGPLYVALGRARQGERRRGPPRGALAARAPPAPAPSAPPPPAPRRSSGKRKQEHMPQQDNGEKRSKRKKKKKERASQKQRQSEAEGTMAARARRRRESLGR
eukprot:2089145-Rhodomonas_salina.4